ncbi:MULTISPECIES: hypothetical protein [unclassified Pseudofrankia]|uniref:hypothetical protein n=1 Tax=unclassified Pseudofrankia TaxID=2994372 RepID=UPI0008D900B4|nr:MULTISPECIES: hypothetical protein [unclassified Pseudofrankia]MDT3444683.1 hypothetical protein [Pseudofrankia sp. BMG5.37]OHV66578.1 hypothetical protein BCD48_35845 [Pseudofrankia sp. BMG5.36]
MTVAHPRPQQTHLSVDRTPAPGTCPACGAAELASYPVLEERGWFDVVKCQACLHSVARERGPLLGYIQLLSDTV